MFKSVNSALDGWVINPIRTKMENRRVLREQIRKNKKIANITRVVHTAFKTYAGQNDITDHSIIRNMYINSDDLFSLSSYVDCMLNLPGSTILELNPYGADQITVDPAYHRYQPKLIRTVGELIHYLESIT